MYNPNVIFAADNIDKFLEEIHQAENDVNDSKKWFMKQVLEISDKLSDIIEKIEKENHYMTGYYLQELSKLCNGTYDFNSMFYDAETCNAGISEKTYQKIKDNPNKYALVS